MGGRQELEARSWRKEAGGREGAGGRRKKAGGKRQEENSFGERLARALGLVHLRVV